MRWPSLRSPRNLPFARSHLKSAPPALQWPRNSTCRGAWTRTLPLPSWKSNRSNSTRSPRISSLTGGGHSSIMPSVLYPCSGWCRWCIWGVRTPRPIPNERPGIPVLHTSRFCFWAVVVCGFALGKSPNPMEGAVKIFKGMVGLQPSMAAVILAFVFFVGLAVVGNKLVCGWACPVRRPSRTHLQPADSEAHQTQEGAVPGVEPDPRGTVCLDAAATVWDRGGEEGLRRLPSHQSFQPVRPQIRDALRFSSPRSSLLDWPL